MVPTWSIMSARASDCSRSERRGSSRGDERWTSWSGDLIARMDWRPDDDILKAVSVMIQID